MQWISKPEWDKAKAGINCSFCSGIHSDENSYGFKIVELDHSVVRLPKNQYMRGWTIVALKRHANELFELSEAELNGFWREVSMVSKALYTIYSPAKINYCVWGNHSPHLHCHLFVLGFDADPDKPINQNEKEVFLAASEYKRMVTEIKAMIDRIRKEV
jgi:diadenosine tetraphosphate (Ap4A) HIT family hydrolase